MRSWMWIAVTLMVAAPNAVFAAAPVGVTMPAPTQEQVAAVNAPQRPTLKRKVAVGRFTNATLYGKALLIDGEKDPLAEQASDMLTSRLVDSGKFLVFERSDLDAISREKGMTGGAQGPLIGVDTLVIGSVTQFGRRVEGQSGFLNSKTKQVATATVEVRLVDVATGRAFFSTTGTGSATIQASEVAGFGSQASYDSTLNDKAISAAVSDLMTNVIQKLEERRWSTDILQVRGDQVFISGGSHQGLKVGDHLRVDTRGEVVTSGQTGLPITLPGSTVATIEIQSFFGDDPAAEGAIARIVDGRLPVGDTKVLVVLEAP